MPVSGDTANAGCSSDEQPARQARHRRARWLAAAAFAAAATAGAIWVSVSSGTGSYPAPQVGPFFGPDPQSPSHLTSEGGFPPYRLGAVGTEQVLVFSVLNEGGQDLRLSEPRAHSSAIQAVRWAVFRDPGNGGSITGLPTPNRTFPATVPARGQSLIRLTVRQPSCGPLGDGVSETLDTRITVDWSADSISGTTDLVPDGDSQEYLVLCG